VTSPAYDRERDLQAQIIELAEEWLGWEVVHFRQARTVKGWRTPVTGKLGKGWPDLILVRGPRIIAAELKSSKGKVTDEQSHVLAVLGLAGVETYVWRPSDWDTIVEVLR
jgi:hypothetical protein